MKSVDNFRFATLFAGGLYYRHKASGFLNCRAIAALPTVQVPSEA
jgi:hypothetical protein